jgi:2-polyprenyl-6-methoxyphenol hydroxylase-like FAD-dependent oxidoreductase
LKKHGREDLLTGAIADAGLGALAGRLRSARQVPGSLVGISAFQPGWRHPGPVAAVGDACVIIPPFAGNGMSMAFEGALMAVQAMTGYSSGKTSWATALEQLNRGYHHHFRTRIRLALFLHPFLTHRSGQFLLSTCIRTGVVPLGTVFSLLR